MTKFADVHVTKNFTYGELATTNSRRYKDRNITFLEYNGSVKFNVQAICEGVLQPMREHFDAPVVIHSGYRCIELNEQVGGSETSQHVSGSAVDFHIQGVEKHEVFDWLWHESGFQWGQLIDEPSWIHISLPNGTKRKEVLIARRVKGKMVYTDARGV